MAASQGYDIPPYPKFNDFKTWDEEGPPKGALSHYPIRGGDQKAGVTCSPAPPLIAAQIWTQAIQAQMIVRYYKGEAMEKTLAWAEGTRRLQADLIEVSDAFPWLGGPRGRVRVFPRCEINSSSLPRLRGES